MSKVSRPGVVWPAISALPIIKYRAVGGDGQQVTVMGANFAGFAQKDGGAGISVGVVISGTATAETGSAITKGALLIVDNQGRVIQAPAMGIAAGLIAVTSSAANGAATLSGGSTPQYVGAMALESAAAAGEFIEVKVL